MVVVAPASQASRAIGGDDVVGLVALLLDAGDVEGAHGVADEPELRAQLLRRLRPCALYAS